MVTLRHVKELAAKFGATVDHEPEQTIVDSPKGKVWRDGLVHGMTAGYNLRYAGKTGLAYIDLIKRMKLGLVDCREIDCEACE